ncbi:glycosyltransferase family 4 protein [Clostridium tertium]|jgi:1,2-diacylglycerol 3-alpha-glucosyltransferase|uniref:glycosyltransferase family 4 protein n=1 Tax=Clostridium tertium TaxID=1559 RepID=UPI000DD02579|nr:glycosyltransferase family 4 protein [Clostridium tertium]
MKVGILTTNISNFGEKGLYNSQEIGMAKALYKMGIKVVIYKLISNKDNVSVRSEKINEGIIIYYIPTKSIGSHGLSDLNVLDKNLDKLIYFSDIQLMLKKVIKWCKNTNTEFVAYVGVIHSNSHKKILRFITNIIAKRNIKLYRNCYVLAKTTYVMNKLKELKVDSAKLLPVGLDEELLNRNYLSIDKSILRKKYNLSNQDKVILFIGRLDEEKKPLESINIVNSLNENFKLIIVGKGSLKERLMFKINELKLQDRVIYIESIPNKDIWELYHLSDYFINLNRNEIFGMAILEAMYYGCLTIAIEAPGPNYIIKNGVTGLIVNKESDIRRLLENYDYDFDKISKNSNNYITNYFMWNDVKEII